MTTPNPGITGTDGQTPIYDPDGRWTSFKLTEIYQGAAGAGRFIPKVDDYVVDTDTDHRYIVTALDPTTFIPTLTAIVETPIGEFSQGDLLLGVGPGPQSLTYRMFVDKSVIPYRVAVDHRLMYPNTGATNVTVFRGSVLNPEADAISQVYNNSGDLTGHVVTLTAVTMNGQATNMKTVPEFNTTFDLQNNEIVTVVAYSAGGDVVGKRELLVENSSFIRRTDASVRYVQSIELLSPFLSSSDPTLLQFPINVLLQGLNLRGKVNYSDGSNVILPVDGTKFKLFGWNDYLATIVGQTLPLVLKYTFASNEAFEGGGSGADRFKTLALTGETISSDGTFSVKLFGFPVWQNPTDGYRLEWYLYNLDRNTAFHVTNYVSYSDAGPAFSPTNYGVNQRLTVAINLHDVSGAFRNYIHTQTIDIALLAVGTARTTNWTIGFSPNQDPRFGIGNHADTVFTNSSLATVRLSSGATTLDSWLARMFGATLPLNDPSVEVGAPAPTHFALVLSGGDVEFPISNWNSTLTLNQALTNNGTLFVKFFKRTSDTDLQLAIAALPIWQTN